MDEAQPSIARWYVFVIGLGLTAAGLIAAAIGESGAPALLTVGVYAALVFAAANSTVVVGRTMSVDPGVMILMASIASFDEHSLVAGAALVGIAHGIEIDYIRRGGRSAVVTAAFNSFMVSIASASAAAIYGLGRDLSLPTVVTAAIAVTVWAGINGVVLLLAMKLRDGTPLRNGWARFAVVLPNFVAFGALGIFVGELYVSLGVTALMLLLAPAAIARAAFISILALNSAHDTTIRVFLRALQAKDEYTARHTLRVAKYSLYMGEFMGHSPNRLEQLRQAALMHDIGKLATPRHLLNKPGKLTPEEYEVVKNHNRVCVDLLNQVDFLKPMIATAADRYGHFDTGDGPPAPDHLDSYIVAVADAFDAMTSTRSYRRALPMQVAFQELLDKSGTQFHPACVEALIAAIESRDERYGEGHEEDAFEFDVPPPVAGVGSAGLGDLEGAPRRGVGSGISDSPNEVVA